MIAALLFEKQKHQELAAFLLICKWADCKQKGLQIDENGNVGIELKRG